MATKKESDHCVYSIKVELEYIGVTKSFGERMTKHFEDAYRNDSALKVHKCMRQSDAVSTKVIFRGTKQECYNEERRLRPHANMGLNTEPGGHSKDMPAPAPSQKIFKVESVRLEKLREDWQYKNTVIKTDRGEYIDYDNNYDDWKSVEGKTVSAELAGRKSRDWEWIKLNHVIENADK
ncbi:MAG: hypothetical protein OXU71_02985 [Gammaproteobacteria bacterium]|nr:hypothetical protein [Gammaproteobacteria bacterium]